MKTKGARHDGSREGAARRWGHIHTCVINTFTRPIKIYIIPSADNIFGKCIPIAGVDVEDIEK